MSRLTFPRFAWGVLIYTLLTIVWGAYVRATFSGDGCGAHWPNCGGNLNKASTLIEFSHRGSTGLLIFLLGILAVWAFHILPKGHPSRTGSVVAIIFTFSEAIIGAGLVLFKLVAHNQSPNRAIVMSMHLTNTFLLIAALALTALWASGQRPIRLKNQGVVAFGLLFGLLGLILLGVSGAVTALGDMLYPSNSLFEGIRQDFAANANFLVRLRPLHPLIAMSVGLYLLLTAALVSHLRPSKLTSRFANWTGGLFLLQIGAGALNFLLKAPVWMQLTHLLLSDFVWINTILLCGAALAEDVPQIELATPVVREEAWRNDHVLGVATIKDYIALTKPRVISLLLFTTMMAMFIAKNGIPNLGLLIVVFIAGYMAAGSANAINMVIDRDIDGLMKRTSGRPTVTEKISSRHALWFAFGLAATSFTMLWTLATPLSALLALAGLVFYVVIYTMILKRRTWHNIVIGGAAGCFPPLVGWAAVTGDVKSILAWTLFTIIFVWTPVHFWALALLLKEDYASVGIPMLPVVRGVKATVVQISGYAVLTAIVSVLPFFVRHEAGILYFGGAILLNVVLLIQTVLLYRKPERPQAVRLFHYSMIYLALLFLFMAVDHVVHI